VGTQGGGKGCTGTIPWWSRIATSSSGKMQSASHRCAFFTRSRSATRMHGKQTPMFLSVRRGSPAHRLVASNI